MIGLKIGEYQILFSMYRNLYYSIFIISFGIIVKNDSLISFSSSSGLLLIFNVEDSPKHLILSLLFWKLILQNPADLIVPNGFATSEWITSFSKSIGLLFSSTIMYLPSYSIVPA